MKLCLASARSIRLVAIFLSVLFSYLSAGSASAHAGQSADPAAEARASAMAATVTIYRDSYGVPHVYGPTDASCAFGFIYAQAEDYFWQMEDNFIRGLGRAAEVYGENSLPDDLLNRALEIPKLSKEEFARSSPQSRAFSVAVADALNYFLKMNPQVKPRLLTHFEPWQTMTMGRYVLYQSFIYQKSGLSAMDIIPVVKEVHDKKVGAVRLSNDIQLELAAAERERRSMAEHIGSNMWAVRPEKSTSGKALLFINPHQPFFGSGQWYEGHLVSGEGWDLLGACFFGSPFPTIGHNSHLAWSHTVNNPDIVDTYAISFDDKNNLQYRYGDGSKLAEAWTDTITVKGAESSVARQFRFTKTHHGPIVAIRDGKPLAIKLAKLEQGGAVDEWYAMGKAKNVAEFKAAMKPCAIPMFNTMVADSRGSICYVYNGAVPKRSTKFDWSKPVDGSNPETDWQGYHAFRELPQLQDPTCGFLQNCNQQPLTTTPYGNELKRGEVDENPKAERFPPYMIGDSERDNGRARSSRRILETHDKFSFEDWAKAAFNTQTIVAEGRIPVLVKEWEALLVKEPERAAKLKEPVMLLKEWNATSATDSVAMTLFALTYDRVMAMDRQRDVGNSQRIRGLEATLQELEKAFGTWHVTWGEINRLQRIHGSKIDLRGQGAFSDAQPSLPIAGAPGPLGIVFSFYALPQKGQKRRYGVAGSSYVGVVELDSRPRAKTILQFGQSGDPASPHWFDQAQIYAKGQFKRSWYEKSDVESNSTLAYHPGEKAGTNR